LIHVDTSLYLDQYKRWVTPVDYRLMFVEYHLKSVHFCRFRLFLIKIGFPCIQPPVRNTWLSPSLLFYKVCCHLFLTLKIIKPISHFNRETGFRHFLYVQPKLSCISETGQYLTSTLPTSVPASTNPISRLSRLSLRLSPMTNSFPSGTISDPVTPSSVKSSVCGLPSRTSLNGSKNGSSTYSPLTYSLSFL